MERLQDIGRRKMPGHNRRLLLERPAYQERDLVPEDGRRKRARPTKTWWHTFQEGMGVNWHGAPRIAGDQNKWRTGGTIKSK